METQQVSKFQLQTTNIKHSTRQSKNAQKSITDSQLTSRKGLTGFDTTNVTTRLVATISPNDKNIFFVGQNKIYLKKIQALCQLKKKREAHKELYRFVSNQRLCLVLGNCNDPPRRYDITTLKSREIQFLNENSVNLLMKN